MFDPVTGLRVFTVPAGADFAETLLDGLAALQVGRDPFQRAAVDIRLNTRRAQRVLEDRMARDARFSGLMPRIGGAEGCRQIAGVHLNRFVLHRLRPRMVAKASMSASLL